MEETVGFAALQLVSWRYVREEGTVCLGTLVPIDPDHPTDRAPNVGLDVGQSIAHPRCVNPHAATSGKNRERKFSRLRLAVLTRLAMEVQTIIDFGSQDAAWLGQASTHPRAS